MARLARIVVPGFPHHVTQRGNRRQKVFLAEDAYRSSPRMSATYFGRQGLDVRAYCLMPNHVHWVVVPATDHTLARGLRDTHTAYAVQFNRKLRESGHVRHMIEDGAAWLSAEDPLDTMIRGATQVGLPARFPRLPRVPERFSRSSRLPPKARSETKAEA